MEAFTITGDDTNALLKFNFELPISDTALQIECNFLEGAASSLPARHVRRLQSSWKGRVPSGLRVPGSPQKSSPAPPSAGRGAKGQIPPSRGGGGGGAGRLQSPGLGERGWGWARGEGRREAGGGGGVPLPSRPLGRSLLGSVTQKFLFRSLRSTPRLASCAGAGGGEAGRRGP